MRLVNPGAGELTDRLTILALKILHGIAAQKDVKHFVRERDVLLAQVGQRALTRAWLERALELGAVNAALWYAEDELRAYRQSGAQLIAEDKIVDVAFRIQDLNDQRATLVQQINVQVGDDYGPEKV